MAKVKVTNLDVWIVENNTVYQAVPFNVVTDWVVQGRLLADDCVRPAGTPDWFKIANVKQLAGYLHQPEPERPNDDAEALEPLAFDLTYKRPQPEEDDEVDMIPLIDVSLVLLIFFMMLLAGSSGVMAVPLPKSEHGEIAKDELAVIVLMDYPQGQIRYGVMQGKKTLLNDVEDIGQVQEEVRRLMEASATKLNLSINVHEKLPSGKVRDLVAKLTADPAIRSKVLKLYTGTGEKSASEK
jgi:biopolymer transport protein ExbD